MLVANACSVQPVVLDLTPAYDALVDVLSSASPAEQSEDEPDTSRLALANIKPRLRMTTLYYLANRYNGLVVGTGNKTELAIGYFTKYGDGGVDLLPLAELDKTAVWQLARALGVPSPIVAKAPSAGLWPGQTDEAEIGITYSEIDNALRAREAGQDGTLDARVAQRLEQLITSSEHKRRMPSVFLMPEAKS
jgi:NAD+ synthase